MKTRRISIRDAVPGMITAEDVYTFSNQLVIGKGTRLSDKVITKLRFYSVSHFSIVVEEAKAPSTAPIKMDSYSSTIKKSPEFKKFNESFVAGVGDFKSNLKDMLKSEQDLDVSELLTQTNNIMSAARNGIHVFDMLHCLRTFDDTTYVHSINVSLICRVFGGWLKLPQEDIEVLTLCGLLHDVGKLTLPSSIIQKKEPLTDEEFQLIKTHTIRGYKILKDKNIDQRVKDVTLMHHERSDGSGYPRGLKGNKLSDFSKIVAIADVYDAMTSPRVYREALCPFDAITLFENEGFQKYEPKYLITFLENIGQTYLGNHVRLSNKLEGEIIMLNKHSLSRPIIKVGDSFIDLSKIHDIHIEAIL